MFSAIVVLIAIVAGSCNGIVTQNFSKPTAMSSVNVVWDLTEILNNYLGIELHPDDIFLFDVPKAYQSGIVRNVILVHRKDAAFDASVQYNDDGTYYDTQGAYDTINCRDIKTKQQKGWIASKFAEPRSPSEPEIENLHDWVYFVGIFSTDLITLTNVSPDTEPLAVANVHRVEIEFYPTGTILSTQIEIYSPGTSFVDLAKKILIPTYGGGPPADLTDQELETEGLYPSAIAIGAYGKPVNVSANCYVDYYGDMHIKIPKGKIFGGFDISVGDSIYDMSVPPEDQINKDGGEGKLGWAKLDAKLSVSGEQVMYQSNVPPAGVLSGGPETSGYIVEANEEIVVSPTSYAWVMGYKVVFMKP